jgi:hypothetical protein
MPQLRADKAVAEAGRIPMKIAINRNICNKAKSKEDHRRVTFSYQNVDLTAAQLADEINKGHAFCAQHKDKHRKSANFTCAGFLAVDIDHGMTWDEALAAPFVQQYATLLYTTPSHTPEAHRFRIVFELESDIADAQQMKHAYSGLQRKLGSDPACTDACRQFWGCKDSEPTILGKRLSDDVLAELIQLGEEAQSHWGASGASERSQGVRSTIRSKTFLPDDLEVTTRDGKCVRLVDLPESVSIHCPVHEDAKASAFTLRSQSGRIGVHCSTCAATYFVGNEMPTYDFDYGLRKLREFEAWPDPGEYQHGLLVLDYPIDQDSPPVLRIQEQYLPANLPRRAVMFIKSPKGSGKTQWLEGVIRAAKKKQQKVLLIGHRQSLILASAKRLKLTPYIEHRISVEKDRTVETIVQLAPTSDFAVCADSLSTLLNPAEDRFDVVIVDEVEQVFSHLTGATVEDRRLPTYRWFRHYVRVAKEVYLLDADLNRLTIETIADFLTLPQSTAATTRSPRAEAKRESFRIIINEGVPADRSLELYNSPNQLRDALMGSVLAGERCFVCSNSKTTVLELEAYLREHYGESRKILAITSDNSQVRDVQDFIRDIKRQVLKFDVVLASPSLGTGVDITFPNGEALIDVVYGFFQPRVNTHFDIDQQISRVRNPKAIRIWISHAQYAFETDPEVVKREIRTTSHRAADILDFDDEGNPIYGDDDGYFNLYANVVAMRRGSMNALRYHFQRMKEYFGWRIVPVELDEDAVEAGKAIGEEAAELREAARVAGILSAKLITGDEYDWLRDREKYTRLSDAATAAMRRYEIESFYGQDATEELVRLDDDGELRRAIANFERFNSSDKTLRIHDRGQRGPGTHPTDRDNALLWKATMIELLGAAGLLDEQGRLRTDVLIRGDQLDEFIKTCRGKKRVLATVFNLVARQTLAEKPAGQLGVFLRLIGLKLEKAGTKTVGGVKVYRYRVSPTDLQAMQRYADHRASEARQQWFEQRKAVRDDRLFGPEGPDDDPTPAIDSSGSGRIVIEPDEEAKPLMVY